ncbi:pimeloyl-ACP methyl ester carboxylesterase [Neobacillus sp. B4I6]|uniref:alpha/beta hydrolase n=1 Tax=Neobacillus sp. B4I6 TaxID=3373925 RepID=UPI003D1D4318
MKYKKIFSALLLSAGLIVSGSALAAKIDKPEPLNSQEQAAKNGKQKPLIIQEQGSFAAGGTVRTNAGKFDPDKAYETTDGQTVHGDHASVLYQIPQNAKQYPMIFLHGYGQSGRSWSTTPDGRDGFQNIFLRKGYGVYLVDQPRRGQAGQSTEDATVPSASQDQMWFDQFRIGKYPDFYDGVQFPRDEKSIDQFFRQMTPNIGAFDADVITNAMTTVFEKTGPGILLTHSQSGGFGWTTAIKSDYVRAIVALEPATYMFPKGEAPEAIPNRYNGLMGGKFEPVIVSDKDFEKLAKIPIIIYFGDNIPKEASTSIPQDFWRASREMAYEWADVVNKHGGDVTVVDLPSEGFRGNTHFIMSDLNNAEVADHISTWLAKKKLDKK